MFKIFFLKSIACFILFSSVFSKSQDKEQATEILNRFVGTWKNTFKSVLDSNVNGTGFESNRMIMNGRFLIMEGITFFENDTTNGITILGFDEKIKKFIFFHIEEDYDKFVISQGEYDPIHSSISFIFERPRDSSRSITYTKLKISFLSKDEYNTEIFILTNDEEILTFKGAYKRN
jgi:hypothetical protein